MSHVPQSITPERWAHLNALKPSSRYLHVSAPIVPNPAWLIAVREGKPFVGPRYLVQRPGKTYNVGRNAAKRAKRAAEGVRK